MPVSVESMDRLRLRGDALADATIDALFEQGQIGHFNTLMRWFDGRDELPEEVPQVAREYLAATAAPPDWVDWDVMETARMFFIDNNVHISTALSFAAMPACYVVPHVARLLSATHSLDYPSNRMAATGQFTVYLMRPDAFEAGGRFVPAAQKVRLLHASIRHHLRREGAWDQERLGVPICQEDMIGGQMMFSIQVLDALHRLGIHLSEAGAEAYFYAWRVVGAMLGVDVEAAPSTLAEARDFSDLYMSRYMGPSDEGVELTRRLVELYEQVVPGTLLDPVIPALIRYLIGDTAADWLAVPRSGLFDRLVPVAPVLLGVLEAAEDRSPIAAMLLDRLGALTTAFELSSLTRGRVMHYAVPEHLKDEYNVPRSRNQRWSPPPVSPLAAQDRA
ncbi:MAG TPA: oxygenase MpaB family protein [Actinospica sp.]|nr:oxygenase MpaB family protein [Actinospica sp.]